MKKIYLIFATILLSLILSVGVFAEAEFTATDAVMTDTTGLNVLNMSDDYDDEEYYEDEGGNFFFALVIGIVGGIVVAFVVTGSMLAKMNTARTKHEASDYVRPGSFELSRKSDRFIRSQTTKRAKDKK